jgi:hypothetical protein
MRNLIAAASTRVATIGFAVMLAAGLVLFLEDPASATVACATAGVVVNITLASGDSVTIGRDVGGSFSVSGTGLAPSTCGGSTVVSRDTVNVTGSGGNESVTIDLSEGRSNRVSSTRRERPTRSSSSSTSEPDPAIASRSSDYPRPT